jgi:hypothetical protein
VGDAYNWAEEYDAEYEDEDADDIAALKKGCL